MPRGLDSELNRGPATLEADLALFKIRRRRTIAFISMMNNNVTVAKKKQAEVLFLNNSSIPHVKKDNDQTKH